MSSTRSRALVVGRAHQRIVVLLRLGAQLEVVHLEDRAPAGVALREGGEQSPPTPPARGAARGPPPSAPPARAPAADRAAPTAPRSARRAAAWWPRCRAPPGRRSRGRACPSRSGPRPPCARIPGSRGPTRPRIVTFLTVTPGGTMSRATSASSWARAHRSYGSCPFDREGVLVDVGHHVHQLHDAVVSHRLDGRLRRAIRDVAEVHRHHGMPAVAHRVLGDGEHRHARRCARAPARSRR